MVPNINCVPPPCAVYPPLFVSLKDGSRRPLKEQERVWQVGYLCESSSHGTIYSLLVCITWSSCAHMPLHANHALHHAPTCLTLCIALGLASVPRVPASLVHPSLLSCAHPHTTMCPHPPPWLAPCHPMACPMPCFMPPHVWSLQCPHVAARVPICLVIVFRLAILAPCAPHTKHPLLSCSMPYLTQARRRSQQVPSREKLVPYTMTRFKRRPELQ